jgi:hypothetical protein
LNSCRTRNNATNCKQALQPAQPARCPSCGSAMIRLGPVPAYLLSSAAHIADESSGMQPHNRIVRCGFAHRAVSSPGGRGDPVPAYLWPARPMKPLQSKIFCN